MGTQVRYFCYTSIRFLTQTVTTQKCIPTRSLLQFASRVLRIQPYAILKVKKCKTKWFVPKIKRVLYIVKNPILSQTHMLDLIDLVP